jgi:hypothetical protein
MNEVDLGVQDRWPIPSLKTLWRTLPDPSETTSGIYQAVIRTYVLLNIDFLDVPFFLSNVLIDLQVFRIFE